MIATVRRTPKTIMMKMPSAPRKSPWTKRWRSGRSVLDASLSRIGSRFSSDTAMNRPSTAPKPGRRCQERLVRVHIGLICQCVHKTASHRGETDQTKMISRLNRHPTEAQCQMSLYVRTVANRDQIAFPSATAMNSPFRQTDAHAQISVTVCNGSRRARTCRFMRQRSGHERAPANSSRRTVHRGWTAFRATIETRDARHRSTHYDVTVAIPSSAIILVFAHRSRIALRRAYSGDSYQAVNEPISGNSTMTRRCGCQWHSRTLVRPPRPRYLPP
jgi:hypothetical protein